MKQVKFVTRIKGKSGLPKPFVPGIRIALVDDNELFRAGIKSLLSAHEEFQIAGEAKDRVQAVHLVKHERPDVILLNIDMKYGDGLGMIPDLLSACKSARLAVLTGSRDPEIHRKAMLLGAIGIISTEDPPDFLMSAIARVDGGGVWIDRHVTARMLANLSIPGELSPEEKKIEALTEREREVIRLVALGLKNRQIGAQLFISEVTVHHHLTSIYSKLEVTGRLELIVYAYRRRLADLPR